MKIKWLEGAVVDLTALRVYIAQDNPSAAHRVALRILQSVEALAEHPHLGRAGRVLHTRELIIPGTFYMVAYRVHGNIIEILRVLHSAMQWPEGLTKQ